MPSCLVQVYDSRFNINDCELPSMYAQRKPTASVADTPVQSPRADRGRCTAAYSNPVFDVAKELASESDSYLELQPPPRDGATCFRQQVVPPGSRRCSECSRCEPSRSTFVRTESRDRFGTVELETHFTEGPGSASGLEDQPPRYSTVVRESPLI